jgi:hypothetical protein
MSETIVSDVKILQENEEVIFKINCPKCNTMIIFREVGLSNTSCNCNKNWYLRLEAIGYGG